MENRRIHCAKRTGHGAQSFVEGAQNSCNPVFIEVGLRLGADRYYKYFKQFGLLKKTGIDLPGEAGTIMHNPKYRGVGACHGILWPVVSDHTDPACNNRQWDHQWRKPDHTSFWDQRGSADGTKVRTLEYPVESGIVSGETSRTVRKILETVVSEGSGKNAGIKGFSIGGKTATSQTLPRGSGRYISSFLGFAPAEDPKVLALCIIYAPQGMYYGGIIAAPVVRSIFENVLPYLGIERTVTELHPGKTGQMGLINEDKSLILLKKYKKTKELEV